MGAVLMSSYYCSECATNWWPYQCGESKCPECGGGLKRRTTEPASPDADARFKVAMRTRVARERSEHNHKLFEAFVDKRDAERDAAFLRALAIDDDDPEQQHGEAA